MSVSIFFREYTDYFGFFKQEDSYEKRSYYFGKTHAPTYTKVDKIGKNPVGNKSIRNFISEAKPDLVVCGHLHENAGKKDKIGKTRYILIEI